MNDREKLADKIEKLDKETNMSMAFTDPKQYQTNCKELNKLRKQFIKLCS